MKRLVFILAVFVLAGCAGNSEIYQKQADMAAKAATHAEAVKAYDSAAKKNINSHAYYAARGEIHSRYGQWGEAVNDYTRALRIKDDAVYHLERGRAYMKLRYYEDASIDFTDVIRKFGSKMPIAYVERGRAYVAQGDFAQAEEDLKRAEQRGVRSSELMAAMADLNYKIGRYSEAKENIQKAIIMDSSVSSCYLMRGMIFYKSKDANQTIADLKYALELDSTNDEAKSMLAWVYAANPLAAYRNGEEALRLAKELYKRNHREYAEVLAAAYAETGDFDKAVEVLEEGIKNSSDLVRNEDFRFDIKNYKNGNPVRSW